MEDDEWITEKGMKLLMNATYSNMKTTYRTIEVSESTGTYWSYQFFQSEAFSTLKNSSRLVFVNLSNESKHRKTINFVKQKLEGAEAGHDWFHIERVWKLSKKIAKNEKANTEIVELAALLHDIADPKFHDGDETLAIKISLEFLKSIDVEENIINQVLYIIENISFKNRGQAPEIPSIELQIVQDADRLDAIGYRNCQNF
jgi:hypothetical protein